MPLLRMWKVGATKPSYRNKGEELWLQDILVSAVGTALMTIRCGGLNKIAFSLFLLVVAVGSAFGTQVVYSTMQRAPQLRLQKLTG